MNQTDVAFRMKFAIQVFRRLSEDPPRVILNGIVVHACQDMVKWARVYHESARSYSMYKDKNSKVIMDRAIKNITEICNEIRVYKFESVIEDGWCLYINPTSLHSDNKIWIPWK